ncbi:MAG: helix-turn-helix domain-containing protein [Bacteroidales bacterium]|nr:MAG: helix-turn-helix domain-containing protein [Bacteroidales bacterium]
MQYREIKIDGFLSNFAKCFWECDFHSDLKYAILPDGYFDLILEIENNQLKNTSLTGIWTKQKEIITLKGTKLIACRFKLPASEYLFKHEIKSCKDTMIAFNETIWNLNALPFENFETLSFRLKNLFLDILSTERIDNRKIKLFQLIYTSKGNIEVKNLSDMVMWSSRQINRYFDKQFGLSLKTFLNILRCRASYNDIAHGELSPTQNYYDQAHFIKDIKRHTGATPQELFSKKNDRFLQLRTIS